jgi:tetratricopeptide (TPR) repeat protein
MPAHALTVPARNFVLGEASFYLRAHGRLQEALSAMRETLRFQEKAQDWANLVTLASNLSQAELLHGDVGTATATAGKAVAVADGAGTLRMFDCRTTQADALHAAGEREKAARLFADTECRQKGTEPGAPTLYSLSGYWYCNLLLSHGRIGEVLARAAQAIKIAGQNSWIRDVALDTLTLGRTHLALALQTDASTTVTDTSHPARVAAKEFDRAVEGLLAAGENEFVAAGLLARGDFRRAVGDWKGAARDLGEAKEIAESGLMRLYWCDSAFAGVRLALAQREAFAPLNGLFEPTPPPPILPDPDTAAALREEAREQLDVAQAHRRMRLPPARRGARGARRRHRRRPPLRRPAAPRLRRVVAILDVVDAAKVVGAGVTSQIVRSGSRRVSDSAVADGLRLHLNQGGRRRNCLRKERSGPLCTT